MTRAQGLILAAGVILFAALGAVAFSMDTSANADFPAPEKQAAGDADLDPFTSHTLDGHPGHVCEIRDHHAGYTYTPHRFPRITGGEITAVIHRGFAPMRIPQNTPDATWIVSPPSEVMY
jgi:hypothetical protein